MIEMYVTAAVALVITGAMAGILVILVLGIRREEKTHSLITDARPGRLTSGTRRVTAAYAYWPGAAQQPGHPGQEPVLAGPGRPPRRETW